MKTTVYGAAHFWVDLCCALLLYRHFTDHTAWLTILLFYNFCAFALQLPFGILADRLDRNGTVAAAGMLLTALSFTCVRLPLASAVLAGCGNALFHVGGGIEILNRSVHKAFRLGFFVAPGALGLFLGTKIGESDLLLWPFPAVLAITAILLLFLAHKPSGNAAPQLSLHPALLALTGVVVLRSYLGFCMVFRWNTTPLAALLAVLALALGKAAGGLLLDRFGYLTTSLCSLLAAACFLLKPHLMITGLLGLFFFQMTMPVTLWAAAKCCGGAKGFSFGLLTFGLFIGFLPILFGLRLPADGLLLAAGTLLSLLLLYFGRRWAR